MAARDSLIQVTGLKKYYNKGTIKALDGVTVDIEKGDVVVVAGKGHENYQDIKGVKHHFDDKEVIKEFFNL